jgi:hypothetical protein
VEAVYGSIMRGRVKGDWREEFERLAMQIAARS